MRGAEMLSRSLILIFVTLVASMPATGAEAAGGRTASSSIRQSFRLGIWTTSVRYYDPVSERVTTGLRVDAVQVGGPAQRVGIEAGDIIVSIDGQRVETVEEVGNVLDSTGGSASVYLRDCRTGQYVSRESVLLMKVFVVTRTESNTTESMINP